MTFPKSRLPTVVLTAAMLFSLSMVIRAGPSVGAAVPARALGTPGPSLPIPTPAGSPSASDGTVVPVTGVSRFVPVPAFATGAAGDSSEPRASVAMGPFPGGFPMTIPVFMYHRVAPDAQIGGSLPGLVVDPRRFAAQIGALQRAGWTTITARALADYLGAGRRPPPHSFVLTFDDGREDGFTYAYPILRRYGFVATFYVISDRIGRAAFLDAHEMVEMTANGMEIASHTMRHGDITQLSSADAGAQLRGSAEAIRAAVGVLPVTFAYPFGKWDPGLAVPLAATGYELAFIEGGVCTPVTWQTRYAVARLRVDRSTSAERPLAAATACAR